MNHTQSARWRRLRKSRRPTIEEKFWARVDRRGANDCWPWTGSITGSHPDYPYGEFTHLRKTNPEAIRVRAHRFAYELLVGPIPDGLVIDHLCNNTLCVNPAHLRPTTSAENVRRGSIKPFCKRGHPRTPENLYWIDGYGRCKICCRADVRRRKERLKRDGRWDFARNGVRTD